MTSSVAEHQAELSAHPPKPPPSGWRRLSAPGFIRAAWMMPLFWAIGAGIVCITGLVLLLNHTSIGLQMRAASMDFRTARLLGVKADTVIMAAVAVSGVLAAVAAVILSISTTLVNQTTGLNETIVVLVGVVAGGIDRLVSATLGGFLIGFAIAFVGVELPNSGTTPFTSNVYLPSVIYLAVIVALLLRPAGLFARPGQGGVERV